MKYKVLIVCTYNEYAYTIKKILDDENYELYIVNDLSKEIKGIVENKYNLIIMDIESDEIDCTTLIIRIRNKSSVPIISLTNCKDNYKKIQALDLGIDLIMDISLDRNEINAQVRAILRRIYKLTSNKNRILKFSDITIDVATRKVTVAGEIINLTSKEYDILYILINNRGKVYDRETLLELIWGYDYFGDSRTVDVHVRRLREKIEKNPENPQHVLTKWGVGYYYKE